MIKERRHLYTRAQVRDFREKAVAFLKEPERRKAIGKLDIGDENRCCLGHMCVALDIVRSEPRFGNDDVEVFGYGVAQQFAVAPDELVAMVGLSTHIGEVIGHRIYLGPFRHGALSSVNDKSSATPQEIGAYLETVIEGGEDTPWIALSDIPESLP